MKITIEGAEQAPSWEALERVIQTCFKAETGKLIRIARPDGKCGYRDLGVYDATFSDADRDWIGVSLEVK